jgi:hypothetical protein
LRSSNQIKSQAVKNVRKNLNEFALRQLVIDSYITEVIKELKKEGSAPLLHLGRLDVVSTDKNGLVIRFSPKPQLVREINER